MDSVFEALFFLAVGLLGITITIFVLSVSLLGRAIKLSEKEEIATKAKNKLETEEAIQGLKDKLSEYQDKGSVDFKNLSIKIKEMQKNQLHQKRYLLWIKEKTQFLKVNGGVLYPGAFF